MWIPSFWARTVVHPWETDYCAIHVSNENHSWMQTWRNELRIQNPNFQLFNWQSKKIASYELNKTTLAIHAEYQFGNHRKFDGQLGQSWHSHFPNSKCQNINCPSHPINLSTYQCHHASIKELWISKWLKSINNHDSALRFWETVWLAESWHPHTWSMERYGLS